MVSLITVVHLINGWTESVFMKIRQVMKKGLMYRQTAHTAVSFYSIIKVTWPYNKDYDGWWGHETLPKLNYEGIGQSV